MGRELPYTLDPAEPQEVVCEVEVLKPGRFEGQLHVMVYGDRICELDLYAAGRGE